MRENLCKNHNFEGIIDVVLDKKEQKSSIAKASSIYMPSVEFI